MEVFLCSINEERGSLTEPAGDGQPTNGLGYLCIGVRLRLGAEGLYFRVRSENGGKLRMSRHMNWNS